MSNLIDELNAVKVRRANHATTSYESKTLTAPSVGRHGTSRGMILKGATCPKCYVLIHGIKRPNMVGTCKCGCNVRSKVSGNGYTLVETS